MPSISLFLSRASLRKAHSTWSPCQNSSDWPKNAPKRMDIAGVVDDLVDCPWGDADGAGHGILRNSHGLEVFL